MGNIFMRNFSLSLARLPIMSLLLILAAACPEAAFPHHGTVGYDLAKTIALHGTASSFDWGNPHCLLYLDVKEESGNVQRWTLEMSPPTMLSRRGWTKDSVKPGDQVTIDAHPAKNGNPYGISSGSFYILKTVVNGKTLPVQ
jgi:hypothetical protein